MGQLGRAVCRAKEVKSMFHKLTITLSSLISLIVVVAIFTMAQGSKKGGLDDSITYDEGVVTTMDNTGMATVQTDRGIQYVIQENGLKTGDKVECTTKEEKTTCDKIS
jgi:hypothetical protein